MRVQNLFAYLLVFLGSFLLSIHAQCASSSYQQVSNAIGNFTNTELISYSGSYDPTTSPASGYQLTFRPESGAAMSLWLAKQINVAQGFTTTFTYKMQHVSSNMGFAFVFQNQEVAARGGSGWNLGYNFAKSAAIEFDASSQNSNDGSSAHICIKTATASAANSPNYVASNCVALPSGFSGTDVRVSIAFSVSASDVGTLSVSAVGGSPTASTVSRSITLDSALMTALFGSTRTAWAGFTSSSNDAGGTTLVNVKDVVIMTSGVSATASALSTVAGRAFTMTASDSLTTGVTHTLQLQDNCASPKKLVADTIEADSRQNLVTARWAKGSTESTTGRVELTNNNDGTWRVQIWEKKTGTYTLTLLINGVTATTYTVTVDPATPSPTSSSFTQLTGSFTAGLARTATVTVRDRFDNLYTKAGAVVAARFGCCSDILTTTTATGAGVVSFPVSSTVATASTTLEFKLNNVQISQSPITNVVVVPNDADGPSCVLSGTGLNSAVVGSSSSIFLSLYDEFGNPISTALSSTYTFKLAREDGSDVPAADMVVPVQSGWESSAAYYKYVFNFKKSGNYRLRCMVNNKPCKNSENLLVTVQTGTVDGTKSTIVLSASALAGINYIADVKPADQFENHIVTALAQTVTVAFSKAGVATGTITCGKNDPITSTTDIESASCSFHTSGAYRVSAVFKNAAQYTITATINGASVTSTAFAVSAGLPVAAQSTVSQTSSSAIAGVNTASTVTLKDKYGNPVSNAANLITVTVARTSKGTIVMKTPEITASGGVHTVTTNIETAAADYELSFYVSGSLIRTISNFKIVPAAFNPVSSSVDGATQINVGTTDVSVQIPLSVIMRDQFKNILTETAVNNNNYFLYFADSSSEPTTATTKVFASATSPNGRPSFTLTAAGTSAGVDRLVKVAFGTTTTPGPFLVTSLTITNDSVERYGTLEASSSTPATITAFTYPTFRTAVGSPLALTLVDRSKSGSSYPVMTDALTKSTSIVLRFYTLSDGTLTEDYQSVAYAPADGSTDFLHRLTINANKPGRYYVQVLSNNIPTEQTKLVEATKLIELSVAVGPISELSDFTITSNGVVGPVTATLLPRDFLRNEITSGLDASKFALTFNPPLATGTTITMNPSGSFAISTTIPTAGAYTVDVAYDGTPVISAYNFVLVSGVPTRAVINPNDQTACYAGEQCSVLVSIYDAFNNDVTERYTFTMQKKVGTAAGVDTNASWVIDLNNKYTFSFIYTKAETVTLNVLYSGNVIGSLADKVLNPAQVPSGDVTLSKATIATSNNVPGPVSWTLLAKDAYGNVWTGAIGDYEIELYARTTNNLISTIPASNKAIRATADGNVLEVSTRITTKGVYYWKAVVKGVTMADVSPTKTTTVIAGSISPRKTIQGPAPSAPVVAGNSFSVTLTMRDEYENIVDVPSELNQVVVGVTAFEGIFGCRSTTEPIPIEYTSTAFSGFSVTTSVSGSTVIAAITTTKANSYDVNGSRLSYYYLIRVNNALIANCGEKVDSVVYRPAALHAPSTILSGLPLDALEAGSFDTLTLTFADSFSNALHKSDVPTIPDITIKYGCTNSNPTSGTIAPDVDNVTPSDDVLLATVIRSFKKTPFVTKAGTVLFNIQIGSGSSDYVKVKNSQCFGITVFPSYPDRWDVYTGSDFTNPSATTSITDVVSGTPYVFPVRAFDRFGNVVDFTNALTLANNNYNFTVTATYTTTAADAVSGLIYSATGKTTVAEGARTHAATLRLDWPGQYDLRVTIEEASLRSRSISVMEEKITVATPICGVDDATKKYYENGQCRESYSSGRFRCLTSVDPEAYTLTDDPSVCRCRSTEKMCGAADGLRWCIPQESKCPELFRPSELPTRRVCTPNFFLCPDFTTCVESVAECPPSPIERCVDKFTCPDGSCVSSSDKCASTITCTTGQVLCPDGTCATSALECLAPRQCDEPTPFKCPDGSCVVTAAACPTNIVCPLGSILCPNGACAASVSACTAFQACPVGTYRCADGSCVPDIVFCPSRPVCADGQVLCPDKLSCAASAHDCNKKQACPATRPVACPSGDCVMALEQCPTPVSCPSEFPVRCSDNSCVLSKADCADVVQFQCPSASPYRCADGTCKKSINACATDVTCPANKPVRCPDHSCAAAIGDCPSEDLAVVLACPVGTYRCASGICAPSPATCPTVRTCAATEQRCIDGTCRLSCDGVSAVSCAANLVQCPVINGGIVCRTTLADCPQDIVCSGDKPVRCPDATCAASLKSCPAIDSTAIPATRVACAGGSWANTHALCGTTTTCPAQTPIKCWDESCRAAAEDCPPQRSCPADKPFRCSDGSCQLSAWSCSLNRCSDPAKPVRCPAHNSNGRCVASISECPDVLNLEVSLSTKCPFGQRCWDGSCANELRLCPERTCPKHIPHLCRNGMCVASAAQCPADNGCPHDAPFFCKHDGQCRAKNTCVGEKKCSQGKTLCADGSCRSALECEGVQPNGCPATKPLLCHDKQCVAFPTNVGSDTVIKCVDTSDSFNACPAARPYRCPGGYCASSASVCPTIASHFSAVAQAVCTPNKPVLCDDGSCAYTLAQCPIIRPCADGDYRCPDGKCAPFGCNPLEASCRNDLTSPFYTENFGAACSGFSTCPAQRPYRCQDGLCARSQSECISDYPIQLPECCNDRKPSIAATGAYIYGTCSSTSSSTCINSARTGLLNGGCPSGYVACDINVGVCVKSDEKATVCPFYEKLRALNGCPASKPHRCASGACVAAESECRLYNGCPAAEPYLHADGKCYDTPDAGTDTSVVCTVPGEVLCPNGHCAAPDQCLLPNGCSVGTPYLCADGTCAKRLASAKGSSASGFTLPSDSCKPTFTCPADKPYLCVDGSCAHAKDKCRPVLPCANSQCAFPCPFSVDKCASLALDENGKCVFNEADVATMCNLSTMTTCPSSAPFLCANGACRASAGECTAPVVDAARTLACPADAPLRCWHGGCAAKSIECITSTAALYFPEAVLTQNSPIVSNATKISNVCPAGTVPCADGACVSSIDACPLVAACPADHLRCPDGSCVDNSSATATCPTVDDCPAGFVRCVDGLCREQGFCPSFVGCPLSAPFSCPLKKTQCTTDYAACHGAKAFEVAVRRTEYLRLHNRKSSPTAALLSALRSQTRYRKRVMDTVSGQEVCAVDCERDVVATQQTVLAQPAADTVITVSTNADGVARTQLVLPSGSVIAPTEVSVYPVSPALFDGSRSNGGLKLPFAFKRLEAKKMATNQEGTFASKVISTPFHCSLSRAGMSVNPAQPIVVSAYADMTAYDSNDGGDTVIAAMPCDLQGNYSSYAILDAVEDVRCPITLNITKDSIISAVPKEWNAKPVNSKCNYYAFEGKYDSHTTFYANDDSAAYSVCFNFTSYSNRTVHTSADDSTPVSLVGTTMCTFIDRDQVVLIGFPSLFLDDGATLENFAEKPESPSSNTVYALMESSDLDPCAEAAAANTNTISPVNICLGYYSAAGEWQCLMGREGRLANPVWSDGMPLQQVVGTLSSCSENAYAFLNVELPPYVEPSESFCWICENWVWVVIGVGAFLLIVLIGIAFGIKFYRDRIKFKEEQAKLKALQERAKELDEFGHGFGIADEDGEVIMVANPLVLQMQELQKQLDEANRQMDNQGRQEEYEIQRLDMQRQRIREEMRRVESELQKQQANAAKPTRIDNAVGPTPMATSAAARPARATPMGAPAGPVAASARPAATPNSGFGAPNGPVAPPRKKQM